MNLKFLTTPTPHDEAAKLIADKPAILRDVFDQLEPELRTRAFTISGIEAFDVLQGVRDEIAKLPAGGDWNAIKKEIIARISPWFDEDEAARRAHLLLSHHGFAAYSVARTRALDSMRDVFPYRQYIATGDMKTRPSHAALDGIILPADHPFWQKHTPPWEWNCRCQVIGLTAEDADEEREADATRDRYSRLVLGDSEQRMLAAGRIVRKPSPKAPEVNVDVRTPRERGGNYEFDAREAGIPYDQIATRWEPDVRRKFEAWARKQDTGDGVSLYESLIGMV